MNLYNLLLQEHGAEENTAIFTDDEGFVWMADDVIVQTGQFAALLRISGVSSGDRVAVQVEKSVKAACLYLACLKIGAVYLPLNTAYTYTELEFFLKNAEPIVVIKGSEEAKFPHCASVIRSFTLGSDGTGSLSEESRLLEPLNEIVSREEDDPAAILYTSGTTGRSKGAMITHGNLIYTADALRKSWNMTDQDVLLHALPIFHAHGLFIALNTALVARTPIHFVSKFSANGVLEKLSLCSIFMGVPTFYARLGTEPRLTKELCSNVRLFISGSAPLSNPVFELFQQKSGHRILERYAMTETMVITTNPLNGERIPGTVGFALPEVSVKVIGDNGQELLPGEVGEIALKGPNVFKGYWCAPDITAANFTADHYFRTGDLGSLGKDGRLSIVGRSKDLIISGGYNVYPGEVEAVIGRVKGVADCAVIGLPHTDFGEGVVAVVELYAETQDVSIDSLTKELKENLANYKVPKKFFFVDELPRNVMGKIQKNDLRHFYKDLFP